MIKYKKGFKYQLTKEYRENVGISAKHPCYIGYAVESNDGWIRLKDDGTLILRRGYGWDGSSGPTWDTNTCMQASAEHDALCKLVRWGILPMSLLPQIDQRYSDKCDEDGMWKPKRKLRHWVLTKLKFYAKPSARQKIYTAP